MCEPGPIVRTSLAWRVCALNAAVFSAAALVLMLSPATISSPIRPAQATTLGAVIAVVVALNLAVLRVPFAPLSTLASMMRSIDPLRGGQRLDLPVRDRELVDLMTSFNAMLDRLEHERSVSAQRQAAAGDAERSRIAAELEAEIGPSLGLLLDLLQDGQARGPGRPVPDEVAHLGELHALAQQIAHDLHSVSRPVSSA